LRFNPTIPQNGNPEEAFDDSLTTRLARKAVSFPVYQMTVGEIDDCTWGMPMRKMNEVLDSLICDIDFLTWTMKQPE